MLRSAVLFVVCVTIIAGCDSDDGNDAAPTPTRSVTEMSGSSRSPVIVIPNEAWQTAVSMPTPRAEVAAAAIDRKIYVVGGFTENGQNSDTVEVYDTVSDTWSSIAPMPERLDHAMAAAANGKLYVMGGWRVLGEQSSDAVHEYDPATGDWSTKASMPIPRAAGAAVGFANTIFVMGGVGPEPEVGLIYEATTDEWRRSASMSQPREHLAAAVIGSTSFGAGPQIYVIGGRWSDRGNVDTLQMYDPTADTWTDLPPMPTARGGLAAATVLGRIHVVGGESFGEGSRTFEEHEVYDPGTNTWSSEVPLPTSRHGLAAVSVEAFLYVIAGGETPGLSVSGIVERYPGLPILPGTPEP